MEISATQFKARCLELLDRVAGTDEVITVTKRGKVVAELRSPYLASRGFSGPGIAHGEIRIIGDIMGPVDIEWEAQR